MEAGVPLAVAKFANCEFYIQVAKIKQEWRKIVAKKK
jgi:hypothetical protein